MNKELEEAIKVLKNIKNSKHTRTVLEPLGFAMAVKQITNYTIGTKEFSAIETAINYIDNSISKEVIEKKYQEAENEVIKIREENIKNNNATKYDYLKVGKRDAYKELLEGK